jgi:type I restriction enzyme S subunit|tara:strand:- start:8700 stop:9923 length:1224 start_codon:yes stop_codon:yes gene_type:complete
MVPNGWEHKSFKQILKLDRGSSPRPIVNFVTDSDDGVNWIKIGDTKGEAAFINSTKQKITKEGAKKSRKVSKGEIILSNSMSYGKPYILNIDGFIHDGWFVIRNYEQNLERDYLIQLLGGELVQRQYKRLAAGGVVTNISSELVYFVKVDIPPLPEQCKIATILRTWDKAISTTERLIDNSKQQKKALMQQLLTGKKRLLDDSGKPFDGEWDWVTLDSICDVKGGKRLPKGKALLDSPTPHPYIRVTDMYMGGIKKKEIKYVPIDVAPSIKNYIINKDDLFITVAGTLGLVGEVPHDLDGANLTENADKLTNIKCDKKFLLYVMKSRIIQSYIEAESTQNAQPKLALTRIRSFKAPQPALEEQQKISAVLTNADKEVELLEQQLADLKQEKKALMQQLLTGKRRVIV